MFPTNDTFATKEYVDNLQVSTDASITANTDALTNFVINNCGDVDTTTNPPVANNTLVWDDVNSKWIPGTTSDAQVAQNTADISLNTTNIAQNTTDIASNTTALSNFVINDCLDVNTTSIAPSVDDTLTWSGLNWVPDGTINADISQNAANIATNTADIAANKLQIDSHEISINDLRANQGAQLVYVVTNVTIGTGATLAGELFVNDAIPSNVNTVSLALTDKNGTAITQPQAGDTLLFTSADQSEEFRYIIDSASGPNSMIVTYVFSTAGKTFIGGNELSTYLFPTNTTSASVTYVDAQDTLLQTSITANTARLDNLVLEDCSNVNTVSTIASADLLQWNGTSWEPNGSIPRSLQLINAGLIRQSNDISSNTATINGLQTQITQNASTIAVLQASSGSGSAPATSGGAFQVNTVPTDGTKWFEILLLTVNVIYEVEIMIQQSGDDGSTKLSVGLDIINNRNSFIEIFNSTGIHEAEFRISNTLHLEVKPLKNASATISVMVSGDSGDRANLDLLTTFKENTSIISYVETGSSISNFMTGALFTTSGNTRKSSSTEIDLVNKTSIVNPVDPTAGNQVGDRDYNDARYSSFQYVDDAIEFASPTYSETINVTDTTTWWKIYDIEAGEYYEMIVNVVQPTLRGSTRLTFGRGSDSTTSVRLTLHDSPGNHSMKFRITTGGHLEINLVEVGSTDLKMTIIGTSSNNPSSRFYNPIQNAGTSSLNTGNAITTQNVFQVRNGALHYPRNQSDPLSSGIGVMFVDDCINLFGQRL